MLASTPASNAQLIERVAGGDREAFAALARRLTPMALRAAAKVLPSAADAEDAAQAALLNLWRRASSFDAARGTAESWFYRLVINAAVDRQRALRPVVPLDAAAEMPCPRPCAERAAQASDEAARLSRAVTGLSARQRAAILMFYGEEASAAEVADALGTTPKAVEGLLARARADLKRMLGDMRRDV